MKNFNFLKYALLCALVIVAIVGITIQLRTSSKKAGSDTLVVGMMSGWPPYMSIDEQGNYVGFDVDVAIALSKKLGKKVAIKDFGSLAVLFLALEQGKIDLILSGLDITQERQSRMNMVPYVGEDITSMAMVFYKQPPVGIKTLADLAKKPGVIVCVEANSTSEKYVDLYPTITKKQLKSMADMVLDIRFSKSTALLAEPPVARRLLKKDPQLVSINSPLPLELRIYGAGIAIRRDNNELTTAIKNAVKSLRQTNELTALETKWNLRGE